MAKGRKTGGRNFRRGEGGRRPGSKNKLCGGLKKSLLEQFATLENEQAGQVERLIQRVLRKGGRPAIALVEMCANFLHGRPPIRLQVQQVQPMELVIPLDECPCCHARFKPDPDHLGVIAEPPPEVEVEPVRALPEPVDELAKQRDGYTQRGGDR